MNNNRLILHSMVSDYLFKKWLFKIQVSKSFKIPCTQFALVINFLSVGWARVLSH